VSGAVQARVGIRCDARPATGVGHLIRCVALAEEFLARNVEVTFLGDVSDDLPWAKLQLSSRGLPLLPAPTAPGELVALARRLRLDAVVTDSYELPPDHTAACREAGLVAVSIVDGDPRGQVADIYVDQNLDAELLQPALPRGAVRLAGLRYALLRDSVRRRRPSRPRRPLPGAVPRVLLFFGGTDAFEAAPVLTRLLIATGAPFEATVVAARPHLRAALTALMIGPGQALRVIEPTDELPDLVADTDVVVSASGSATWELFCLGVSAALIWVVDNQRLGFDRVVDRGLAVGLGRLDDIAAGGAPADAAREALRALLVDLDRRERLATRAWSAVDAKGRDRVVDEVLRHIALRRDRRPTASSGAPSPAR
jgi:spore coat polysaccharide biosynthesis predicted glycosyltransferase SpsG